MKSVRLFAFRTQNGAQIDSYAPQKLTMSFSNEIPPETLLAGGEEELVFKKLADFTFNTYGKSPEEVICDIKPNNPPDGVDITDVARQKIAEAMKHFLITLQNLYDECPEDLCPSLSEHIEVCCSSKTAIVGFMSEDDKCIKPYDDKNRLVPGAVESYYNQQTPS